MIYSRIMVQAYAEANGITIEEAASRLKITNKPFQHDSYPNGWIDRLRSQEILADLRQDRTGVQAWTPKGK